MMLQVWQRLAESQVLSPKVVDPMHMKVWSLCCPASFAELLQCAWSHEINLPQTRHLVIYCRRGIRSIPKRVSGRMHVHDMLSA